MISFLKLSRKILFLLLFTCSILSAETAILHTQDRHSLHKELSLSLKEAKTSILIFMFTFSEPELLTILNQKASEGVDITVVMDKEHLHTLISNMDPRIKILTRNSGEGRVHHKIVVLDKRDCWVGSLNLTKSAFTSQENVMIRLESDELAAILHNEMEYFSGKTKRDPLASTDFTVDGLPVYFGLLPHDGFPAKKEEAAINKQAKKRLLDTINAAKEQILIAMMVWTDPELATAVCKAHARGVDVLVIAPDLGGSLGELIRAGISVRVNPKLSFMHNKCMYIDRSIFVNGSANWSKSSFTRNDESFIILYDITNEQKLLLDDYWNYLAGN